MTKRLLVDCDGVLLNFHKSFDQYVEQHYPEFTLDINSYSLGLTDDQMKEIVSKFNTDLVFSKMEAYSDSVEYVNKLKDLNYKFVAITTCLGTNLTKLMRELNLHVLFGYDIFEEIICLPIGTSKYESLKKFEPTYWIDDKLKHCISGTKAGHTSFEMIHSYNINDKRPDDVIPVNNWKEIYEYIISH